MKMIILLTNENDLNRAININYLLDGFASNKKLSKKDLKLKSKSWINNLILIEINKLDRILGKYSKMKKLVVKLQDLFMMIIRKLDIK